MSSRGAAIVRFNLLSMRKMFLLCPWRVHNCCYRGADVIGRYILFDREADVIGRYYIFVKTVLLVLVEGFTSIGFFDVFFLFRSSCLALDWEIDAGIERYWDCRFTLAIMRCCRWNWDLPFYLAFVIFVRDLSYLEPSRGAVCDTVSVSYTHLTLPTNREV